jgi:integrase
LDSIRSEGTRKHYSLYLQKYFEFAGSDIDNAENKIIQFISEVKKKGKSHGAIQNYLAPIKLYYSIHDVTLNTKKIDRFLPEQRKHRKDRAYTHEEISKLLQICDERMKVVILLMASSGIRIGSIPNLRIRHLQDNNLTVYEGDKEEYLTFMTSECQKTIDNYIDMRSRYGEKINDNSFLIREQFNTRIINAKPKTYYN